MAAVDWKLGGGSLTGGGASWWEERGSWAPAYLLLASRIGFSY